MDLAQRWELQSPSAEAEIAVDRARLYFDELIAITRVRQLARDRSGRDRVHADDPVPGDHGRR